MGYFGEGQDKWGMKKQNRIIRTYEEPVLPLLCRILFWSMIILTSAMAAVDLSFFIRFDMHKGIFHLISNVAVTGFFAWLFFSVFLIPCSLAAVGQVRKTFRMRTGSLAAGKPGSPGSQEKPGNPIKAILRKPSAGKAQAHLEAVYFNYVRAAAGGLAVWGILLAVSHVFL